MLLKIDPQCSENRIARPDRPSEFEVQSYLRNALQEIGVDVIGEVVFSPPRKQNDAAYKCRFDLVCFVRDRAVAIIEVKASPVHHKSCIEDTRQYQRYVCFGVPVYFVYGMDGANDLLLSFMNMPADQTTP